MSEGPSAQVQPRQPEHFEEAYKSTPPWDIGKPQPAFAALARGGAFRGRVLDAGCGTGEHALLAAGLGLQTTGIDMVAAAIAKAQEKARERGLSARFQVGDALHLSVLGQQFDTVVDCGLFHVFADPDRQAYVESLTAAVAPGGRYFMLCFSERQPGDFGPRRVTQAEIRSSFAKGWRVDSIEAVKLIANLDPPEVEAWLASLTRI